MHENMLAVGVALGGAASFITVLGVLWKKVVSPISHTVVFMGESVPVLRRIAKEFENNGGSSLKDQLDEINRRLTEGGEKFRQMDLRFDKLDENDRVMHNVLDTHVEAASVLAEHIHARIASLESGMPDLDSPKPFPKVV